MIALQLKYLSNSFRIIVDEYLEKSLTLLFFFKKLNTTNSIVAPSLKLMCVHWTHIVFIIRILIFNTFFSEESKTHCK